MHPKCRTRTDGFQWNLKETESVKSRQIMDENGLVSNRNLEWVMTQSTSKTGRKRLVSNRNLERVSTNSRWQMSSMHGNTAPNYFRWPNGRIVLNGLTFMVGQSIEVREGIQQMEDPFWVQSRTSSIFMQVLVKKCPTVRGSPLTFLEWLTAVCSRKVTMNSDMTIPSDMTWQWTLSTTPKREWAIPNVGKSSANPYFYLIRITRMVNHCFHMNMF